jgi:cleavage stimulation factor subunit 2
MVSDLESGKPRGFAFVEFEDPQAALGAIRNLNDYELNGRRLRVNFSNSSHLETLAGQLGMDMSKKDTNVNIAPVSNVQGGATGDLSSGGAESIMAASTGAGTQEVANALKNMSKGEMYDVIAKLKQIADEDPDEARKIISGHPQLPEALLFLMSQLDMVKTPYTNVLGAAPIVTGPMPPVAPAMPTVAPPVLDPRDPRARMAAVPSDPRAAASDPRARMGGTVPPPPPPVYGAPPPQQAPPPPPMGIAGLDPTLVQQVMSLTPAQISQLPPDKQASILALRQQITAAMGGA